MISLRFHLMYIRFILEFFRPAVHAMRSLNADNNLNETQDFFFKDQKPNEELHDLQDDLFELTNLADDPLLNALLDSMRNKTKLYDIAAMTHVSPIYHTVHPESVDVFEWVTKEKPQLFLQMFEGVDVFLVHSLSLTGSIINFRIN